jgi:ribosomal protein S8E
LIVHVTVRPSIVHADRARGNDKTCAALHSTTATLTIAETKKIPTARISIVGSRVADSYPRAFSLESPSSKRKKILGACLFKMDHLGVITSETEFAAGAAGVVITPGDIRIAVVGHGGEVLAVISDTYSAANFVSGCVFL